MTEKTIKNNKTLLLTGDVQSKPETITDLPTYGPHNPLPFALIVKYAKLGLNQTEIAKQIGVSRFTIWQHCTDQNFDIKNVNAFQENKVTILTHKQQLMVDSLTPDAIKKMSPGTAIVGIGVFQDKIADIEAAKGPEKKDVKAIHSKIANFQTESKELEAELAKLKGLKVDTPEAEPVDKL